jgi:hypothetical protein
VPRFTVHTSREDGEHRFNAYDCTSDGDLVEELAALVRDLYIDQTALRARMLEAADAVGDIADTADLNRAVEAVTRAAVPEPGVRETQPHLDTARNELGEVLAYAVLEDVHGGVMPAKRVGKKEIPELPSRGLDALAFQTGDELRLLVSEVKTSDEDASPPRVVGDGNKSLHAQTLNLLGVEDRMLTELNWVFKHCGTEHELMVARAIFLHAKNELPITAVPVLIRPTRCHQESDCGVFETDPDSLEPARVLFSVVRIGHEIDDLANAVYGLARGDADAG